MLAVDFFTVESISLQRFYILFFIELGSRRVQTAGCTANPTGAWVTQQARNLVMQFGDEQPFRFLVHDRDAKFSHAFDEVFRSEGPRDPYARPGAEGERGRRALCPHRPRRVLGLAPDRELPTPRTRAARVRGSLQHA